MFKTLMSVSELRESCKVSLGEKHTSLLWTQISFSKQDKVPRESSMFCGFLQGGIAFQNPHP